MGFMVYTKQQLIKEISLEQIKEVIKSANLADLRVLDICLKERRDQIIKSGEELFAPSESLSVSKIRGTDYLYLHKKVSGKTVSRVVNENDLSNFNFDAVKISPKARQLLQEKYKIQA
jgi:hypothetical protein